AAGLAGLEVDHPDHDERARAGLRAIADELGLARTGSSDHHGVGKGPAFHLGANLTDPEQLERLLA
ncbi:MAG: phosphatase, partial [Aeromicrobium sp.]